MIHNHLKNILLKLIDFPFIIPTYRSEIIIVLFEIATYNYVGMTRKSASVYVDPFFQTVQSDRRVF